VTSSDSHLQAGLVAFVAGLATIGADSLAQVGLIVGAGVVIAAAILILGRRNGA
jgi:hypothetical protein